MASSLGSPFRRFVHATSCSRLAASAIRPPPLPPTAPPTENVEGARRGASLDVLLNTLAREHEYVKPMADNDSEASDASAPHEVSFTSQSFVRPIDLHRDFNKKFTSGRRGLVGPGREARYNDIFLQLNIDPRFEVENVTLLSDYTTRLGRIQTRPITRLTQRSQRILGKAIKRAKMMGIIPIFSNGNDRDSFAKGAQTNYPSYERRERASTR
ncbi:hypothetical protein DFH11DRAFT_1723297 [Phellopilus nigrolimitatus]|nr:hypothetical protein DFH11DRAFT_1723297 [Phellopilus nigrolimitatus]